MDSCDGMGGERGPAAGAKIGVSRKAAFTASLGRHEQRKMFGSDTDGDGALTVTV